VLKGKEIPRLRRRNAEPWRFVTSLHCSSRSNAPILKSLQRLLDSDPQHRVVPNVGAEFYVHGGEADVCGLGGVEFVGAEFDP
jgi:hypothetical protein